MVVCNIHNLRVQNSYKSIKHSPIYSQIYTAAIYGTTVYISRKVLKNVLFLAHHVQKNQAALRGVFATMLSFFSIFFNDNLNTS